MLPRSSTEDPWRIIDLHTVHLDNSDLPSVFLSNNMAFSPTSSRGQVE
jgi:hypothetical protein